jgi:molecular chaperone DnaK (HSP70)
MSPQQPVLGIDLGTTYCAVAVIDEFGRPEIVRNSDSEATTPSVVYFESADSIITGKEAKRVSKVYPDETKSLVKRQMGDEVTYSFHGVVHHPESVSAIILNRLVADAFESLGIQPQEPVQVVITVPAYFGIAQKQATRNAGEIAGLEVLAIIPEPVAAALAYGARAGTEAKTIFVYDLGGGTFDTTILRIQPDQIEVVAIDGDKSRGGVDWDNELINYAVEQFREQKSPDLDPEDDEQFMQGLALDVEEAKKSLSSRQTVNLAMSYAGASLKLEVTRELFESQTSYLLESTLDIVDRTMAAAKAKEPDLTIDEVLLVGGSSKMPLVSAKLEERLGIKPIVADPDLSVAKGAAIYTTLNLVVGDDLGDDTGGGSDPLMLRGDTGPGGHVSGSTDRVRNVLPKAFGIVVWDLNRDTEYVDWLVPANASLPVERIGQTYALAQDNTTSLHIRLFEQATEVPSERLEDNVNITPDEGAMIVGIPNLPQGTPIEVEIEIDHEGLAHISAQIPSTGQKLDIPVQIRGLEQHQIDAMTEVVSRLTVSV